MYNFFDKKFLIAVLVGFFLSFAFFYFLGNFNKSFCLNSAQTIFSPNSKAKIIDLIKEAKNSIDLEMYILSDQDILNELEESSLRGVKIRIILEDRVDLEKLDRIANFLDQKNIELRWASLDYKLSHSKFMIIDKKKVLIGSINFSKSALTSNREAALVLEGELVKDFLNAFEIDWQKARIIKN
ncbi:MAG: phospholipase D-like domain-containing protein [Candidatus Anstonellaceae archaeon]